MTYFEDLTRYTYQSSSTDAALNVGWLAASQPFPTGQVPAEAVHNILRIVLHDPVNRTRGWHQCDLCADPPYPIRMDVDGTTVTLGDAEIRVRGRDGAVYAAPSLIAHYIVEHDYCPPRAFVAAVSDWSQRDAS